MATKGKGPFRRRVLLVGEGNFSFAYGLRHCKEIEVLATGYDAEQVLVR